MTKHTTIDTSEVAKFAQLSQQWWDVDGPLKTLHDINFARIEFIKKHIKLSATSLLDVGCGGGILSEGLAREGANVIGLDVEPQSLAAAKHHAVENGIQVDYICSSIECYEAQTVSAITCMEMLEHVADPQLVIEHCARLLEPNGLLFLSTINRTLKAYASLVIGAEYLLNLLPRQTHDYAKFLKPSELTSMARKFGLEPIDVSGLAYNPFTRIAELHSSVDVNYLLVCRKPFSA
jgi:2-polyprenyl-6-hydroxyphenyl methylase/3-demethylubiquinone-9 3-methyltransferase